MMRIGLLAQLLSFQEGYRQAGVSRYIEYLLRYAPAELQSDETLTVYAGPDARHPARLSGFDPRVEWHWTRWPTGRVPVRILWEQLAAPFLARQAQLDLIHAPVNIVPLVSGAARVVTIHDLAFLEYPEQYPSMQRRYLTEMTRASTRRADRVIAVSEYTARDVAQRLDVDPERITAVPNGVDASFVPRQGSEELRRFKWKNSLPADFLLFVGTLQPRKNLIGLLRAYARIPAETRIPLYVVGGEGWMYREIFDEVSSLGISRDVVFPGYAASETLPLWYSAAAACIYPSYYEGFGLPVLEAMACGVPVVTSDRTSLPEVAGDAAILVNPDDPDDIASGITMVLEDAERRHAMSRAGVEQAGRFTWQRTARETVAVYRNVLGRA
jgi:glycosyltransferase involved in cell wall biosynthesis